MTNGTREITRQALKAHSGDLLQHVDEMMEVAQPGLWKPRCAAPAFVLLSNYEAVLCCALYLWYNKGVYSQ